MEKVVQYADGIMCRAHNKRVSVFARKDDKKKRINVSIQAILPQEELNFTNNCIKRGKLKQTAFSLTREAATMLYLSLHDMLCRTLESKDYWLNSEQEQERSVATIPNSSNVADNQKEA